MTAEVDWEENLWKRACEGDPSAFGEIFDRHVDRVHGHAVRLTRNREDAEDIVAMTFLEAWRSRRRVRVVDGSIIAWLLVTATNLVRNLSRSRMRYEQVLHRLHVEPAPDHADAVHDKIATEALYEPIRAAFGGLSRADQEVLALCVIEALRPREVAAMMRVPSATIRTRLSRAKGRLRAAVDAGHPGAFETWMEAR